MKRAILAIKKLAFCRKVSANFRNFLRIVKNTKRYSWSNGNVHATHDESPTQYEMILLGRQRTLWLRTFTGDLQIFFDVFWKRIYTFSSGFLPAVSTVVDLGAHTGLATLYFRMRAPNCTVYSVEPDPQNFNLLLKNLEPDIQSGLVVPIHAAITTGKGPVFLQRSKLGFNSSLSPSPTLVNVPGLSIVDLLNEWQIDEIDLLKVDIEGGESHLFGGDTSWMHRVRNLVIEIHGNANLQQFRETMLAYQFKVEKLPVEYEEVYWAYKNPDPVYF